MDNQNARAEDFDIDSYLEKWNEENAAEEADGVEDLTQTEENDETAAGPAEEPSKAEDTPGAEESDGTEETDLQESDSTDGEETEAAEDGGESKDETTVPPANEEKKHEDKGGATLASAFKERFDAALAEIQTEFPDVRTANDIGDIRAFVILTTVGGKSALDAYKEINKSAPTPTTHEAATAEELAAAEARGAQKAAGKSHLRSAVPKGAGEGEGLSDREAEEYAEALGITPKEAKQLYRRVTK